VVCQTIVPLKNWKRYLLRGNLIAEETIALKKLFQKQEILFSVLKNNRLMILTILMTLILLWFVFRFFRERIKTIEKKMDHPAAVAKNQTSFLK